MTYDAETQKWFREIGHWNAETTVCKCEKCGLFYKPQLGHKCKEDKVVSEDEND